MFTIDFYKSWPVKIKYALRWTLYMWFTLSILITNYRSGSSAQKYMQYVRTCASFIIMWAKTWRNPTIASHSLLWARDCWLPVQGPWRERLSVTHINKKSDNVKAWFVWFDCLPECTQLDCWKSVLPLSWLWRNSSCLVHQWCPCQSNTSRNHWWTPWQKKRDV